MGDFLFAGIHGYELNCFDEGYMQGISVVNETLFEYLAESIVRGFVVKLQFHPAPLTTTPHTTDPHPTHRRGTKVGYSEVEEERHPHRHG